MLRFHVSLICIPFLLLLTTQPAFSQNEIPKLQRDLYVHNFTEAVMAKPEVLTKALSFFYSVVTPDRPNPYSNLLADQQSWAAIQNSFRGRPSVNAGFSVGMIGPVGANIGIDINLNDIARIGTEYAYGVSRFDSVSDFNREFSKNLRANRHLVAATGEIIFNAYMNPTKYPSLYPMHAVVANDETNLPPPDANADVMISQGAAGILAGPLNIPSGAREALAHQDGYAVLEIFLRNKFRNKQSMANWIVNEVIREFELIDRKRNNDSGLPTLLTEKSRMNVLLKLSDGQREAFLNGTADEGILQLIEQIQKDEAARAVASGEINDYYRDGMALASSVAIVFDEFSEGAGSLMGEVISGVVEFTTGALLTQAAPTMQSVTLTLSGFSRILKLAQRPEPDPILDGMNRILENQKKIIEGLTTVSTQLQAVQAFLSASLPEIDRKLDVILARLTDLDTRVTALRRSIERISMADWDSKIQSDYETAVLAARRLEDAEESGNAQGAFVQGADEAMTTLMTTATTRIKEEPFVRVGSIPFDPALQSDREFVRRIGEINAVLNWLQEPQESGEISYEVADPEAWSKTAMLYADAAFQLPETVVGEYGYRGIEEMCEIGRNTEASLNDLLAEEATILRKRSEYAAELTDAVEKALLAVRDNWVEEERLPDRHRRADVAAILGWLHRVGLDEAPQGREGEKVIADKLVDIGLLHRRWTARITKEGDVPQLPPGTMQATYNVYAESATHSLWTEHAARATNNPSLGENTPAITWSTGRINHHYDSLNEKPDGTGDCPAATKNWHACLLHQNKNDEWETTPSDMPTITRSPIRAALKSFRDHFVTDLASEFAVFRETSNIDPINLDRAMAAEGLLTGTMFAQCDTLEYPLLMPGLAALKSIEDRDSGRLENILLQLRKLSVRETEIASSPSRENCLAMPGKMSTVSEFIVSMSRAHGDLFPAQCLGGSD